MTTPRPDQARGLRDAATALRRFGLGARPGDIKEVATDPQGFVVSSLSRREAALLNDADLDASHQIFADLMRAQIMVQAERQAAKAVMEAGAAAGSGPGGPPPPTAAPGPVGRMANPPLARPQRLRQDALADEAAARIERAVTTATPFLERLVMFWSGHFCVSAAKGNVRALAGSFEREAIRPHVLGRFSDMLKAVVQHPAMLIYLDNQASVGPNSPAGRNRKVGLNENLAREVLELHTLGVDGGYSQADVTNFARILTGWTFGNLIQQGPDAGKFFFAANRNEPGDWTVLGKTYPNRGQATGEAVLADLAAHPSTARHVARKFAAHFVAAAPPAALVARLEATFTRSGGDLGAMARTLAEAPEAWAEPPRKIIPPYDFVISLVRGLGHRPPAPEIMRLSAALGQPLWMPPSPKGWPEDDNAWMGPSAIRERLRIAEMVSRRIDRLVDPRAVAGDLLGGALSEETRSAIARAETREQGLELLIMSPEFLRR